MRYLTHLVFLALLCGCTVSNHNLNEGPNHLGGGFSDSKVASGIFWISAQTNFAPWSDFEAARKMFKLRATELCGSDNFLPLKMIEKELDHIPRDLPPRYILSQVSGYVVCESSDYTFEEVERLIQLSIDEDV
jgi:hypothetical protein